MWGFWQEQSNNTTEEKWLLPQQPLAVNSSSAPPHLWWNVDKFSVVQAWCGYPQNMNSWVQWSCHVQNTTAYHRISLPPSSGSYILSIPSSVMLPEPWRRSYRCFVSGWALYSYLPLELGSVVSLCNKRYLPGREVGEVSNRENHQERMECKHLKTDKHIFPIKLIKER